MRSSVIAFAALFATATAASAGTPLTTLKSFCSSNNCTDGEYGMTGNLAMDASGTLYGATWHGGATGYGVVFSLTPEADKRRWNYTVLYDFCSRRQCRDGGTPLSNLLIGADGSLYGTTSQGGHASGGIFKLTPNKQRTAWKETVLYHFCKRANCKDGAAPRSGLTFRGAGPGVLYDGVSPLYGAAYQGGKYDGGAIYELSFVNGVPTYRTIYNFCRRTGCPDGLVPNTQVAFDASGNLYGTTELGGVIKGGGLVFELLPRDDGTWREKVLYNFCSQANCTDGTDPETGVVPDNKGNVYGATEAGGTAGHGLLYKVTRDGTQVVLHEFCGDSKCADGAGPRGDIILGKHGVVTGVTIDGGPSDNEGGVIYRFDQSGFTVLHTFCAEANCADGNEPLNGVIADDTGKLYGTTQSGGAHNDGLVYQFKP